MALPTLDATFASAADLPRRQMLAKWLVNLQYSGSIEDYWTLPEHYLWAKIAVAAGAPRSEADYISLPKNYVWSDLYSAVSGSSSQTIDRGEKEAIGWIAAAVRGDAGNPQAVATYINWPWRYQVASIITALAVDADAQSFITTSGATDVQGVDKFVKGVKNLGLWDDMVAWPLRSSQNAGTGTTAYSLGGLGTYNGTLVNGPAWTADGIVVAVDTERMTTTFTPTATSAAMGIALKLAATGSTNDRLWTSDQRGTTQGLGLDAFDPVNGNTFRRLSSNLSNFGTTSTNWTFLAVGGGAETFVAQDASRTTSAATNLDTPHNILQLGNPQEGARPATYSFAWWINGALDAAGYTAFRNLYKQTLGAGLSLP